MQTNVLLDLLSVLGPLQKDKLHGRLKTMARALSKMKTVGWTSANEIDSRALPPTVLFLVDFLSLARHAYVWRFCGCVTFTSRCGLRQVKPDMQGLLFVFCHRCCSGTCTLPTLCRCSVTPTVAAAPSLQGQMQTLGSSVCPLGSWFPVWVQPSAPPPVNTPKHFPASVQQRSFQQMRKWLPANRDTYQRECFLFFFSNTR